MKTRFTLILILIAVCSYSQNGDKHTSKKANKIHKQIFTIDSHTDSPLNFFQENYDFGVFHDGKESRTKLDLVRMEIGGLDAVFLAVFVGQGQRNEEGYVKAAKRANNIIDTINYQIRKNSHLAEMARSPEEAYQIVKSGKKAILLGMENGYPIGNDPGLIETFYNKGIRYITLCHSRNNDICDSSTDEPEFDGLSEFGEEVIAEMNRLGIMIDLSHVSDESFFDVIQLTRTPVLVSHSNSRELCNHPRNLSDNMLEALAENNGVVQVCMVNDYIKKILPNLIRDSLLSEIREKYSSFEDLSEEEMRVARKAWREVWAKYPRELASVSEFVDHIDHIVHIAGIDHVGIGSDFDGGGSLSDCCDISEIEAITQELVRRKYSKKEIEKIWGRNLMRVFREVREFSTNSATK